MWEQLHCHIPSQRSDFCVCPAAHTYPPSEFYRQSELSQAGTGVFPAPDPPSELYSQNFLGLALGFFQPQLHTLLYPELCPPAALPIILVLPTVLRWCSARSAILPPLIRHS